MKDYDAVENPVSLPQRFDLSNWGFFAACLDGGRVGGAVVVRNASELDFLEGRTDLALLWDIRVAEEVRGKGVGSALFRAAGKNLELLLFETVPGARPMVQRRSMSDRELKAVAFFGKTRRLPSV